jgi:uncharacterized membrane protein YjfL (UPF0719 family)
MEFDVGMLVSTIVYALLGIVLMGGSFWVITKVLPFSVRKEIEDDQNTALAILVSGMFLGIAIIIAASISG